MHQRPERSYPATRLEVALGLDPITARWIDERQVQRPGRMLRALEMPNCLASPAAAADEPVDPPRPWLGHIRRQHEDVPQPASKFLCPSHLQGPAAGEERNPRSCRVSLGLSIASSFC